MTRRTWSLFFLVGFLWGIPYLLMKVAVQDFPPPAVVFGRTLIGAAMLIPYALYQGTFTKALRGIRHIIPYAFMEMIASWILITSAEQKISSGVAGLLVATVPIWATIIVALDGDKSVLHSTRLFGIFIGFLGLVLLIGLDAMKGHLDLLSVGMVLLASIFYSIAPKRVTEKLPDVSGVAINGLAMAISALFYAPFTVATWPHEPIGVDSIAALIALGIFSTGFAFVAFFIVLKEMGPARSALVTYLNTAFAVVLGILVLGEPLTLGVSLGLPIVLIGSYLASRKAKTL